MRKILITVLILSLVPQVPLSAKIVMPVLFGDGMVLQRNMPLRIFGEASEGAVITVSLNGQSKTAVSQNGQWKLSLESLPAGGPYELHISGDGEEIVYRDVMLGEVWLAGGQSNMALPLQGHVDFENFLPAEENPGLRFIHIPVTEYGEIDRDGLEWKYFDRESVRTFSAVAYFFATELQKRLGVTVAVIGSYRGGTWNENWMTPESIKKEAELKYLFENYEKEYAEFKDEAAYEEAYQLFSSDVKIWEDKGGWSSGPRPMAPLGPKAYQRPSGLYNCMIRPLQPYSIKGCIWYQGEGNSARHEEFRTLFPAFVEGWRKSWQQADLPFYFVQLPGYGKGTSWPQFRQAQLDCFRKIDNCGMVVSEGCNDEEDIHPKMKKPIGDRLAIAVTAEVYGQGHIPYGPVLKSHEFRKGKAKVRFEYSGSGLVLRSDDGASFEIAGADKEFKTATVQVKKDMLLLSSKEIKEPKYLRYAFSPNPAMVLFNQEGLPASPFTTENHE